MNVEILVYKNLETGKTYREVWLTMQAVENRKAEITDDISLVLLEHNKGIIPYVVSDYQIDQD
jgi:hypothetical protein